MHSNTGRERKRQLLLKGIDGLKRLVKIRVVVGGKEGLGSWFGMLGR
jgi:hypothetical protein